METLNSILELARGSNPMLKGALFIAWILLTGGLGWWVFWGHGLIGGGKKEEAKGPQVPSINVTATNNSGTMIGNMNVTGPVTFNNAADEAKNAIRGTTFTRSQMTEVFPFGYGIIHVRDDGSHEFEEVRERNDMINWEVDWKNVAINREVTAERLTFTIPTRASSPTNNPRTQVTIGTDGEYLPIRVQAKGMKTGNMTYAGFDMVDQPVMCVAVLSDNQRRPVFAIGFRIKTESERRKRK